MSGESRVSLLFLAVSTLCAVLTFTSLVVHGVAFSEPNWLESNPAARSKFVKLGLSVACFDKFQTQEDNFANLYDGCYHINSGEVSKIRNWLVPGWYQKCYDEGAATIALQLFALIMVILAVVIEGRKMYMDPHPKTKQRQDKFGLILSFSAAVLLLIGGGLLMDARHTFGNNCFGTRWLPTPHANIFASGYYLGRSAYILTFVSAALALATGVFKMTYVSFVKKTQPEQRIQMFSVSQMANMAGGEDDGAVGGEPINAEELPEKSGLHDVREDEQEYDDDEYEDDDDARSPHQDYQPRGQAYRPPAQQPAYNHNYSHTGQGTPYNGAPQPTAGGYDDRYRAAPQQGAGGYDDRYRAAQQQGADGYDDDRYNVTPQKGSGYDGHAPYYDNQRQGYGDYRGGPNGYDRGHGGDPYAQGGANYGYDSSAPTSPVRPSPGVQPMMRPIERNVDMPPYEDDRYAPYQGKGSSQV